jgi:hypothetical protein
MNNPGIDLAIWVRLRKRWSELESDGQRLKIDFRLIADPDDEKNILAIDVIQNINKDVLTETIQRNPGEAYSAIGIAELSMERLVEVYKEMMCDLHRQAKQHDADLIVTMTPTSPVSGEVTGYVEKPKTAIKNSVPVDYRHYYVLNMLREKMMKITGEGWSKVMAVYSSNTLEFHFEY